MWTYWGICKKTAFKAFTEATPAELIALSQLGVVEMPSADVVLGCERFLCRLLGTKKTYRPTQLKKMRWKRFQSQPGGYIKSTTSASARYQHNYTPGVHAAAYVWSQGLLENQNIPDPFKVGWLCDADKISVSILSDIAITPELISRTVIEFFRCGCGISKCSRRCSCRQHNVTCTEARACGADKECTNTAVHQTEELESTDDLQDDN